MLRIALLHLAPKAGQLLQNQQLVMNGMLMASELDADWVVTPELCLSGYEFAPYLGVDWIEPEPDSWTSSICDLARQLGLAVFLGHAERDQKTQLRHNTVFVIGPAGNILGTHRKRTVIPGVEDWSSRGEDIWPILIPPSSLTAGVLICADAYTAHTATRLQEQGAEILISCAAWGPRPHGPETSWEDRSRETGLPLFVCNRTGPDHTLNFHDAESVVVMNGKRLLSFQSEDSALVLAEWDLSKKVLARYSAHPIKIQDAVPAMAAVPEAL